MSLKELTSEKHREAESTKFMKAVFNKTLPFDLWVDWTYQKWLFYHSIEGVAGSCGLLGDLPDIRRAFYLYCDYRAMANDQIKHTHREATVNYHYYIMSLSKDPDRIMAHLYTWHMGDMFGGQMIKKIVPGSHSALDFVDTKTLMTNIRTKLNDNMAQEANIAFDWAIKLMREYDQYLE